MSPTDGRFTIVVPVVQCRDRLASHLLYQEAARGIGGKYLEVPAGLYLAWNRGIQEVQTEFTYISTVGEFITPEGLLYIRTILSTLLSRPLSPTAFIHPTKIHHRH